MALTGSKKRAIDKDTESSANKRARGDNTRQSEDDTMEDATIDSASSSAAAGASSSSSKPSSAAQQQPPQFQPFIPFPLMPLQPQQFSMPGAVSFGFQPSILPQQILSPNFSQLMSVAPGQFPLQNQQLPLIPIPILGGQPLQNQSTLTALPPNLGSLLLQSQNSRSSSSVGPANLNNANDLFAIITQRLELIIKFLNIVDNLQLPLIKDTPNLSACFLNLGQYTFQLKNLFTGNEQKSDLSNLIFTEFQRIAEFWKKEIQKFGNYICFSRNSDEVRKLIQEQYPISFDRSLTELNFTPLFYTQEFFIPHEALLKLTQSNAQSVGNSSAVASSNSTATSSNSNNPNSGSSPAVDSGSASSSNSSLSPASSSPATPSLSQPGNSSSSLAQTTFFQQSVSVSQQQTSTESKTITGTATPTMNKDKSFDLDEKLDFHKKFKEDIDEWFIIDPITASRMVVTFIDHFCKPFRDTQIKLDQMISLDLTNFLNFCKNDAGKNMQVFSEITKLKISRMGPNQPAIPKLCTFIDDAFPTTHLSSSSSNSSSSSKSPKPQLDHNVIIASKYLLDQELAIVSKNWYAADFLRTCRVFASFYDYAVEPICELQSRVTTAKTSITVTIMTLAKVDFKNFFNHPEGKKFRGIAEAILEKMKQDPGQTRYLAAPMPKMTP